MKLKYKREKGIRVYYTEDKQFKIIPDPYGFHWYRMRDNEYYRFGFSTTLFEARDYLEKLYHGTLK